MHFTIGRRGRDTITGFEGVITGRCEYLTGCNQLLIVPKAKGGSHQEGHWFDEQRVELIGEKRIVLKNGNNPGPDNEAPKR